MELSDLKFLAAASLLAGSCLHDRRPSAEEIAEAVRKAQEIWEEVLRQKHKP